MRRCRTRNSAPRPAKFTRTSRRRRVRRCKTLSLGFMRRRSRSSSAPRNFWRRDRPSTRPTVDTTIPSPAQPKTWAEANNPDRIDGLNTAWVGARLAARIGPRAAWLGGRTGQPVVIAFDEMKGSDGSLRPAYGELFRWLSDVPPDVLDYRRREAEVLFRRIGITFAVYGEADAQERLIPFDVLPRILATAEWDILRAGLEQRVKALNHYIRDVYTRREILKAGVVPEDLVFQNRVFR